GSEPHFDNVCQDSWSGSKTSPPKTATHATQAIHVSQGVCCACGRRSGKNVAVSAGLTIGVFDSTTGTRYYSLIFHSRMPAEKFCCNCASIRRPVVWTGLNVARL